MTITIVCDILGEENNGTTIACMNLIRFLHAQGHTVRVVCADQDKAGNECFYVVPELNLYLLNPIVERNGVTLPRVSARSTPMVSSIAQVPTSIPTMATSAGTASRLRSLPVSSEARKRLEWVGMVLPKRWHTD